MKLVVMATALIPACFVLACGTKKHEKKVPVEIDQQSSDSTAPNHSNALCPTNDVNQNQDCHTSNLAEGEMLVMQQNSWLNPLFNDDGSLQDHEGVCLEKFTAVQADQKSLAWLDINLVHMNLKEDAARCRMQIRVAYKKGYAFAIRRVEVPLIGRIPVDSNAVFEGSYGIKGKKQLVMEKVLETRYSEKPLRLDHTVADQDIVWSSCKGLDTLVVDTGLSLDFSSSDQEGDLRIDGHTPYRLEIVWAKCQ